MQAHILSLYITSAPGVGSKVKRTYFSELSTEKTVDRLLTMICMIPEVNLGVGEMGFMLFI